MPIYDEALYCTAIQYVMFIQTLQRLNSTYLAAARAAFAQAFPVEAARWNAAMSHMIHCETCGAAITQTIADWTRGVCVPCAEAEATERKQPEALLFDDWIFA